MMREVTRARNENRNERQIDVANGPASVEKQSSQLGMRFSRRSLPNRAMVSEMDDEHVLDSHGG
jgi:hypothetical protein